MKANADLGTDVELLALVAKVKGFDFDDASPAESVAISRALRIIAQDTIARHEQVRNLQRQLEEKLAIAEVAVELRDVVTLIRPQRKRGWFNLGR